MFNSWMNDPEAFSGEYDEYRQFAQEQARPERDPLDYVREADEAEEPTEEQEAEAQERYERYAEDNLSDVEADADTLASAGMGTDEDYGYYGGDE